MIFMQFHASEARAGGAVAIGTTSATAIQQIAIFIGVII